MRATDEQRDAVTALPSWLACGTCFKPLATHTPVRLRDGDVLLRCETAPAEPIPPMFDGAR
jgi:hypothetical protein